MRTTTTWVAMAKTLARLGIPTTDAFEYLAVRLGANEYGIDIRNVQEVCSYKSVSRIADGSRMIDGVVISRGVIMPIVDMRTHFNLGAPLDDQSAVVIIMRILGRVTGLVVDSVSDVIPLKSGEVQPVPEMDGLIDTHCLIGLGVCDQRRLILVDVDQLMLGAALGQREEMTV